MALVLAVAGWVGEAGGRQAGSWQAHRDFHIPKAIYGAAGKML